MNRKEKLNKVTATSARFSRIGAMSLGSKIAMGILALVVLMSVLSPFVSPYGPDRSSTSGVPPPASTCSELITSAVTSSLASCTADVSR